MRAIDADALIDGYRYMGYDPSEHPEESYMEGWCKGFNSAVDHCIHHAIHAPTIEPDQEKPAKWIIYEVANCDGEPPIAWECPECGEVVNCKYKFCPECGKPMEV